MYMPQKAKYYPTIDNTTRNPYGISDEVVELARKKPIAQRLVSCYFRTPVYGWDAEGDRLPIFSVLRASSPQVYAMRSEPSHIERKRLEDQLPIFTPYCVLTYSFQLRAYYPICYTCLMDFNILQSDNKDIDLEQLRRELPNLPQIAYCGLATNGIDLFCIIPISTPQRYSDHARALIHQFRKSKVVIRVDDYIAHTRTLSSDPNGYFNENAVEFRKFY
jgi:hypothetical protein